MAEHNQFDIQQIMSLLPHRYPFLLIDRVIEHVPGISVIALKNVTINEPFFQGHFPGVPIMPGVLIMEALAQAGAIGVLLSEKGSLDDKMFLFTGMDKVRFRRPVVPGDQLILDCRDMRSKLGLYKMHAKATVNGVLAAQAELTAALAPRAMPS